MATPISASLKKVLTDKLSVEDSDISPDTKLENLNFKTQDLLRELKNELSYEPSDADYGQWVTLADVDSALPK